MMSDVKANLDLIQNLRIIQALNEIGLNILIDERHFEKFEYLEKYLGYKIQTDEKNSYQISNIFENVTTSHSEPYVRIFTVEKTLIFPKSIFSYLKDQWPVERQLPFTFSGLITLSRKKCLKNWIDKNISKQHYKFYLIELSQKIPNGIRKNFRFFQKIKLVIDKKLLLSDSILGRKFPFKSFDVEYYESMLNSKFVLCPDGDFIWTYRFFEAIICGAIPIVENECEKYKEYRYKKMSDDISNLEWNAEDAEYNFRKCLEQLTLSEVEKDILISEFGVKGVLKNKGSVD